MALSVIHSCRYYLSVEHAQAFREEERPLVAFFYLSNFALQHFKQNQ